MGEDRSIVNCSYCSVVLPLDHLGPCPSCGREGRYTSVELNDKIPLRDSITWETRHNYYQKNKGVQFAVIAIALISPFLGLALAGPIGVIAGIVLGGLSYFIGPMAVTKVIKITKSNT